MFLKNRKYIIFLLVLTFIFLRENKAQVSVSGVPESFSFTLKSSVILPKKVLEDIDTAQLIKEDSDKGIQNRYGVVQTVNIDIKQSGTKTEVAGKGYIWRYEVSSANAYSLGLMFTEFYLPTGARLYIYNSSHTKLLGAFSEINNNASKQLAIADFDDNEAIVEYFEPYEPDKEGSLVLGSVTQAYRDIYPVLASTARININCSTGDLWQDDKHAVCRMTFMSGSSGYYCTGFLVNNTRKDGTPYFMTANHCISTSSEASTLVTYFNYENSGCNTSDASATQTLSGATLKATNSGSDFTLLLLNEVPPRSYLAFLAGWDASGRTSQNGTCIHHPEGAPKCISQDNDAISSYAGRISWDDNSISAANTHWDVKFDSGNTEGGSSGSPLFDDNHRAIGQLHGGDDNDSFYGKFSVSWNNSTTTSKQLKAWLDPDNSGSTSIDGTYLNIEPVSAFSVANSEACIQNTVTLTDKSKYSPNSWKWEIEPATFSFVNGTSETSQNPQVVFTSEGYYSLTLMTANDYGSDTLTTSNFINVVSSIDVNFTNIPEDNTICGCNLNNLPLVAKGASLYTFSADQTDKLTYSSKSDTVFLSLVEDQKKYGSFTTKIKVKGTLGTCMNTDSVTLQIAMPPNDDIKNALTLSLGNNGEYSNFCGSAESNEPQPPLTSCNSDGSWCPDDTVEHSIWFTFIAPSNGKVTIETSKLDSKIAVYEAASYSDIISGNSSLYSITGANDNSEEGEVYAKIDNLAVASGKQYWLQVDGTTGVTGNIGISLLSNSLELFPNPSDGNFTAIISGFFETNAKIEIFSANGRKMLSETVSTSPDDNQFQFNLSDFPAGIYMMYVRNGSNQLHKKFTIIK